MSIKEENLIPVTGDYLPGQRFIMIDGTLVPVGFGTPYIPGSTLVTPSDKGVYYKCASVDADNSKWTGYKATQLDDGTWSFAEEVTTDLTFTEIKPEKDSIYSYDALVKVKLWNGSLIPEGYLWGYQQGELLPDNTITATNTSVTADSSGFFTFGSDKYFDFDSQVITGASPRTFLMQATLTDGQQVQLIDGGSRSSSQMFSIGWGRTSSKLFYHFWSNDNSSWLDLSAGSYVLAFVYDGSVLTAYKDGVVLGTYTTALSTGTNSKYRIGQYVTDDWSSKGSWTSNYCIVYDKALTAEEIKDITDHVKNLKWIVIEGSISKTFKPSEEMTYSIGATDNSGNTCSYELVSGTLPEGVAFDASTGTFSGTPTTEGSYEIVVRCYTSAVEKNVTVTLRITTALVIPENATVSSITYGNYSCPIDPTGYTQGNYTISASSELGDSVRTAYNAFYDHGDLDEYTRGWHSSGGTTDQWLQWQSTEKVLVTGYSMSFVQRWDCHPYEWKLQGSDDGSTWTDIDSISDYWDFEYTEYGGGNTINRILSNTTPYYYHRLYVVNATGDYVTIGLIRAGEVFEYVN